MEIKMSPKKEGAPIKPKRSIYQYESAKDLVEDLLCFYSTNASIIREQYKIETEELHKECVLNVNTKMIQMLKSLVEKLRKQGCEISSEVLERKDSLDMELLILSKSSLEFSSQDINFLQVFFSNPFTDTVIDVVPGESTLRIRTVVSCIGLYYRKRGGKY